MNDRIRFAARCALAASLVCGGFPTALAQDRPATSPAEIAGLYQAGVRARLDGRIDEALELLSRAASGSPDNADVLLQQGLALSAKGRDDDAAALFRHVLSLEPGYDDAWLALARIAERHGDIGTAETQVGAVLRNNPRDVDARELHARLLLDKGDARGSETEYRALGEEHTSDASALIGLGDSLRAQWRDQEARTAYRTAAELAPDSAASQRAGLPDHQRFRLDISGEYSRLSNGLPPWKEGSVRLAYAVDDQNRVAIGSDLRRRFAATDVYSELRLDHRYSERLDAYVYGGGTPDASTLPKWALGTGAQWRLTPQAGKRSTYATFDGRYARYAAVHVWSGNVGLIQYLDDDQVWITAKWINTLDEHGRYLTGYALRTDWQARRRVRVLAGFTDAPESDQGLTVRTRAIYGGIVLDINDSIALNVSAARELRERLYNRDVVGLGMTVKF
ncbi:YaiO family outer membrane beta-barrel protein [Burkholderia sp. BCC1988]|uniref:YaiO family outer membrane beta-barrel protein n=1 Tax=Burkholderia sp. BCC1988 TaxID=2817443 RepID=UPI002AAFA10E|nr:YaiO family outer membrane beta-barrel protein [Burkholderia sp. BCC1988]